jgi:pimeloyl-ACP methyl ester carboxylesterase
MGKLRILCLHGFTSNGSVHAHQVRHLTKRLSNDFDFIFADGPHIVSPIDTSTPAAKAWADFVAANSSGVGHRAWWYAREASPTAKNVGTFSGVEESLEFIGDLMKRTGPVHGIWGFSQGACFAAMLVALLGEGNRSHPFRKFLPQNQGTPAAGIFFSGFKARFAQYDAVYAPGIESPTMHVMGEKDDFVSIKRSEELMGVCRNPVVLTHLGGHDIPKLEPDQDDIVKFLRDNLRERERQLL